MFVESPQVERFFFFVSFFLLKMLGGKGVAIWVVQVIKFVSQGELKSFYTKTSYEVELLSLRIL